MEGPHRSFVLSAQGDVKAVAPGRGQAVEGWIDHQLGARLCLGTVGDKRLDRFYQLEAERRHDRRLEDFRP